VGSRSASNSRSPTAARSASGKQSRKCAEEAGPALLGAQDRQYPQQVAEEPATESKRALQEIWMTETKKDALVAFDAFVEPLGAQIRQGGRVLDQGS
jgi:hypothetical protein